jgi:thiol-disulfide isomerase/thioredoxin
VKNKSGVVFAILFCLSACSKQETAIEAPPAPEIKAAAKPIEPAAPAKKPEVPTLEVTTFDGKPYKLADHRGKWVVVNFWATWCEPCKKEIPDFNVLDEQRSDIEFIGLAYEEIERADMEAFLKVIPINYPMAILDVYSPPADFDTPVGLPLTYVIAPDGKVASKFLGPVSMAELEKVIGKPGKTKTAP